MRVLWTARRSNQSILREMNPEYLLEGLMLKLKLQYFGHLIRTADSLEKSLMLGKIEGINSLAFCCIYDTALTTICDHWEDCSLDYTDLCWQSNISVFNTLFRFVIAFLPRSLLISWLQSPSALFRYWKYGITNK